MRIHLWGTDFRRGTPEIRKRLYFAPEERAARLKECLEFGFTDLVYLYTCNRIEFYTTARNHFCDTRANWTALLRHLGLEEDAYFHGYQLEGKSALRHLVRVAASLESLVVGEPQILGQLKESLRFSRENEIPIESSLEKAFQFAFETAKRVRTETAIGERPTSVANLGLQHLQAHETSHPLTHAVVVGRSPISLIVLQWLRKERPECPVVWVNRNVDLLEKYPESQGVSRVSLSEFLIRPMPFSHLFTATSSREPIFTPAFFGKLGAHPKLVFDFAEPPDIAAGISNARIIHLENLQEEARANREFRAQAVEQAETIVEARLRDHILQQKEAPLLRDFSGVETRFWDELQTALPNLEEALAPEQRLKLRRWAEALVRRNLHNSREHLRTLLRQVSDPVDDNSPVL